LKKKQPGADQGKEDHEPSKKGAPPGADKRGVENDKEISLPARI
jgi:hypothetical protein